MKILVVEDEGIQLLLLTEAFAELGFEVRGTCSAREAIQVGISWNPDLIISDWNLNDFLDGIQVCAAILKAHPQVKIILVSGSPDEQLARASEAICPRAVMQKPIRVDRVLALAQTVHQTAATVADGDLGFGLN